MKANALLRCVTSLALLCPMFSGFLSAAQMNVLWTSESGVYAPVWVTREADLFEKHGNRVQLIFIQGATSAAAALITGDAQVAFFIAAGGTHDRHERP
jgi:ABC-type nitrate/sulfonate/bicarbonate transport system substrate-binding protein